MKALKYVFISLILGVILTFAIGGIKYAVFDKPGFDPLGSCGSNPLCDPNPYLHIGAPWSYGYFNDAHGETVVLGFGSSDSGTDGELVARNYRGLAMDVMFYAVIVFALLTVAPKFRRSATKEAKS